MKHGQMPVEFYIFMIHTKDIDRQEEKKNGYTTKGIPANSSNTTM